MNSRDPRLRQEYGKYIETGRLAKLAALLALAAAPCAPLQAQDEAIILEASDAWRVDEAQVSCGLQRRFASDAGSIIFDFRKFGLGESGCMTLISPDLQKGRGEVAVQPAIGDQAITADAGEIERFDTGARARVSFTISDEDQALLSPDDAVRGVMIVGIFKAPVYFQTGNISPALAALDECVEDLMTGLGSDVAAARSAVQPALRIDFQGWASDVIRRAPQRYLPRSGSVSIRLTIAIGSEGRPTGCIHDASEEFSRLGIYSCNAVLEDMQYEPALDGSGSPVPATDAMTVIYYR